MYPLKTNRDFERTPHPARYRLTDKDGKVYARFRVKPGASLAAIIAQGFPGQDEYEVEAA